MARIGISYSDVARAAAWLVEANRIPTVDSVREALGNTGSKSTIGPFLKRWKEAHEETVTAAESGLPAPLLEAVKNLHAHIQAEFAQERDELQEKHAASIQEATTVADQLRGERDAANAANDTLYKELVQTRQELTQLQQRYHEQSVTLAATQAENAGLQQRLLDRAAEVASLEQQLNQTRTQFEHFQEVSASQRLMDHQAHEQRTSRLEKDLASAQRHIANQQSSLSHQEARITQLEGDLGRETDNLQAAQQEAEKLRAACTRLEERLEAITFLKDNAMAQVMAAQGELTELRVAAATHEREAAFHAEHARRMEARVEVMTAEKMAWIQEREKLQHLDRASDKNMDDEV